VSAMPFIEANFNMRDAFHIVGDPPPAAGAELRGSFNVATPGYFRAMGIRTVRGRALDDRDRHDSPPVAVVSEAFADRYFRGRDPIGRRVAYRLQGRPTEVEIVGVTAALRHQRLDEAPRAELFRPFAQTPTGSMTLVAHSHINARALVESAKHAVWAVDPLQTFYSTSTIDELVGRTMATRRFVLLVLAAFGALALLLAAAGLYGVVTAIAMQQRREIGVRLALGARWVDVLRLVLARGLAMVVVGVVAGSAGAFGAGRLLASFLYGVSPADPWAIGGAALVMLGVAMPACLLPASRAASTDPVEVLRPD
jgi:predicted permease